MNFLSNISHQSALLMGMAGIALSECLGDENTLVGRTTHTALIALSMGLLVYGLRQAHSRELNLRGSRLTTPPDLSHTPTLRSLDLSNNQLTASPDLSHTPALRLLNLSDNRLTTPPDLSHTPALRLLNLSDNRLTTPPDLSHTPALEALNLSDNQLTTPPDLSHTPALRSLILESNRLTASPDLSHTPALRSLILERNQLTTPPDLSPTPALRSLNLNGNQLTTSPDLSHTPALRLLNLSNNQLTTSPDLSHTPALRLLHLTNSQLTTPPDLSHTPALRSLHLGFNQLTASPDLSHTPALRLLNLSNNQLTTSPDLSHTPALDLLHLNNNRLTALHDSILHLPQDRRVFAEGNRFSAEYAAAFQQRLQAHRLQHPGQGPNVHMSIADDDDLPEETQTLEQRLREWSDEFEEMFPTSVGESRPQITDTNAQTHFEPLLSLGNDDKNNLSNYLRRLRETKDYRNGTPASKKNVVFRMEKMLRLACKNGEFKGKMLALINEGLTSCHDRVLITFNDIEIQWRIHRTQSESELLDLLVRVERYEQLRKHAIKIAEERGLGDQIETILHYQIALKKQLDLPISTQGMLYQAMSGVTQTMLKDAYTKIVSLTNEDLLSQSEHWRVYLEKKHAGAISKINEKFSDLLEVAGNYYDIYGIDDTETSSQKRSFLETHADFAQLLKDAVGINHYSDMAKFIKHQREAAITALGSESTDTLYLDQAISREWQAKSHKADGRLREVRETKKRHKSDKISDTPLLVDLSVPSSRKPIRKKVEVVPYLSHTPAPISLNLSNHCLTVPPDLSHIPALCLLNLSNNQCTTPPDLSHTPALELLSLGGNRLTTPPDLSHTPALRSLDLSNNRLTVPPDLSHTPALRSLHLDFNQLTALHDSILHLPRGSYVSAERNRFSAEYVATFQQRLQDHRLQHPDQGPTVHMSIADDVLPAETQTLK